MANRHEYDPLLRSWVYGGPGVEGFDHTADGYNFWCGDMARGVTGITLGSEPKNKKLPEGFENWTDEQEEVYWQQEANKNLSPQEKRYLELGRAARKAALEAGII